MTSPRFISPRIVKRSGSFCRSPAASRAVSSSPIVAIPALRISSRYGPTAVPSSSGCRPRTIPTSPRRGSKGAASPWRRRSGCPDFLLSTPACRSISTSNTATPIARTASAWWWPLAVPGRRVDGVRISPERRSRPRWSGGCTASDGKSSCASRNGSRYANLHKFDTANPHIAAGLIWAGLCAALLKRFLAHAAQRVGHGAPISTRRVAMCAHLLLTDLVAALVKGRGLRKAWQHAMEYLLANAGRSNVPREQRIGRLRSGLVLVGSA